MNKKRTRMAAWMLCGWLLMSLAGCGTMKEETTGMRTLTLVLDWTPNTNHTGIYVALEKGYFAEEGLEVEVVQPPEDGASALVAAGRAEFGIDFQDSLAPALAGESPLPITAVATIIQHNTSGIISRAGEGIDRPKGMEGKRYATWNGPIEIAMVEQVVADDGGDHEQIQMIPSTVTDEVTALQSEQIDAIWVYYAWAGIAMEVHGVETDYFAFADMGEAFDYYTPVIVANDTFLQEEPETAKAFLRALEKGYEDAIADPEEAADILCEAAPELDEELVKASQAWLAGQYQAEAKQWGYIDQTRWDRFHQWLWENGLIESEIPKGYGFSNDYLAE